MTRTDDRDTENDDDPTLSRDGIWRQLTQQHYDPDRDSELTTVVIFAIAEAKNIPPDEVKSPPLYEVINVAGVEAAFFSSEAQASSRDGTGTVQFRYTDLLVKIRSDGWIQIYQEDKSYT